MDTYYKYSGLMNLDFFNAPSIKISVPQNLNDPFESEPSENIIKAIEQTINKECPPVYFKHIKNMIACNGLISLTETQRNLLMWAHYGDHHKGMCLGFKSDFFNSIEKPDFENGEKLSGYCTPILNPKKINYDNHRFDINKAFNDPDFLREAFLRHFYTKSDEWIYEKEHRCIVPYAYATHIIIGDANETITSQSDGQTYTFSLKRIKQLLIADGTILPTDVNNKYKINYDKIEFTMLIKLAEFKAVSYLIEIAPHAISEIHFGYKVEKDKMREIYNQIKSNGHPLNHVKLFYLSISKKRFELHQYVLDEKFFQE